MASRKSYELWFSVNGKDVAAQMQQIDKSLRETGSEYKLLKTNLENGFSTEKWSRAKTILTQAISDAEKKAAMLAERLRDLESSGEYGDDTAEVIRQLNREITATENEAQRARDRLKEIDELRMNQIKSTLSQVSAALDSVGKKLTLGVTAPLVAAGAASFKMAADMDESINKVDVAFGDAADSVHAFSNETLTTYGIAKSTALDMAGYFGDMATSMGFSREQAAEMSKQLVGLAGDLASFKNISLSEAQTALAAIFTGETESLKQLGIVMTETNLEAYAMAQGIETSTKSMDQAQKTALRMQYVLENTKNAQGDFARTSDSSSNQLRILTESLKELAAIAGQELIPIITPIIQKLNSIIQSIGKLDDGTKEIITKVAVFAASFGPLLSVSGKMVSVVTAMITAYKALKAAQAAATAGQTALNAAMSANAAGAIAALVGVVISALGSLAITSALTSESVESLSDAVDSVNQSYRDFVDQSEESVREQEAELSVVERLLPRYEELNGKVDKTAAEKKELAGIVEKINEALPGSIELIDKETALYKGSTEEINKNIEARKNEIKAIAAKEQAQKAASAQLSLLDKSGFTSVEEAEKELERLKSEYGDIPDMPFDDFFMALTSNEVPLKQNKAQMEALENLIASYNEYESKISSWLSDGGSFTSTESTSGSYLDDILSGSSGKTPAEKALEQYQTARKKLEHQLAMDEITEAAFYSRLETISAQYLAGYTELEDERNRVQEEAYQYRKKLNEQMLKDAEEARKKELSNLKEFTDTVISLAEEEANAKIAAIDAELAAREKLEAAQKKELQLQQAKAKLVFTRDEDSRESLQREIARLQSEIDKQNAQAQADAQKAAIQQQIDALKASTAATIAGYQNQLMPESVNPYVSQLAPNITVNASGLSVAQAQQLIDRALQKLLYGM